MKYVYDPEADCAYLYLMEQGATAAHTKPLSDHILIDVDAEGNIIGIEFLFIRAAGMNPDMLAVAPQKITLEQARNKVRAADQPVQREPHTDPRTTQS